jgi:magnesium-transporting ATPase (P-type)
MIVKIKRDEYFPADLIIINSSGPKGICYIETKDLDGETNLKHKQADKRLLEIDLTSESNIIENMKGAYV